MSDNRLNYDGMEEFKQALRQLPAELSQDGGDIVVRHAEDAGDDIRSQYAASAVTGDLAKKVRVRVLSREAGAAAIVESTAKHAYIYENGTQIRKTKNGKNLGAMPPAHVFVPTVIRARRAMVGDLKDLMTNKGLEVTGG
jgi:hypothetical protein